MSHPVVADRAIPGVDGEQLLIRRARDGDRHAFDRLVAARMPQTFRLAKAIPIAPQRDDPVAYEQAFAKAREVLNDGDLLCIFPEGALTRDGQLGEFKGGVMKLLESNPVPVVPLALQNLLWGLGQPIAGAIADRFGILRVMIVGALLYAGGLLLMRYSTTPLSLDLGAGVDDLAALKTPFRPHGNVTAGNAAGINDGATAALLADEETARELGLPIRMRLVSYSFVGVEPEVMGAGPIPATEKALRKAGLGIDDIGLIEINEAFAVQVLAFTSHFGIADDDPRVNPYGGAIAMGHPLGATGAMILGTLIDELARRDLKRGLATLCVGGGMGIATVVELV